MVPPALRKPRLQGVVGHFHPGKPGAGHTLLLHHCIFNNEMSWERARWATSRTTDPYIREGSGTGVGVGWG